MLTICMLYRLRHRLEATRKTYNGVTKLQHRYMLRTALEYGLQHSLEALHAFDLEAGDRLHATMTNLTKEGVGKTRKETARSWQPIRRELPIKYNPPLKTNSLCTASACGWVGR